MNNDPTIENPEVVELSTHEVVEVIEVIVVINDEDLYDDDDYNQVEEEVQSENMNGDQIIETPEVVEVSTYEVDELFKYEEINDDDLDVDVKNSYTLQQDEKI